MFIVSWWTSLSEQYTALVLVVVTITDGKVAKLSGGPSATGGRRVKNIFSFSFLSCIEKVLLGLLLAGLQGWILCSKGE